MVDRCIGTRQRPINILFYIDTPYGQHTNTAHSRLGCSLLWPTSESAVTTLLCSLRFASSGQGGNCQVRMYEDSYNRGTNKDSNTLRDSQDDRFMDRGFHKACVGRACNAMSFDRILKAPPAYLSVAVQSVCMYGVDNVSQL